MCFWLKEDGFGAKTLNNDYEAKEGKGLKQQSNYIFALISHFYANFIYKIISFNHKQTMDLSFSFPPKLYYRNLN